MTLNIFNVEDTQCFSFMHCLKLSYLVLYLNVTQQHPMHPRTGSIDFSFSLHASLVHSFAGVHQSVELNLLKKCFQSNPSTSIHQGCPMIHCKHLSHPTLQLEFFFYCSSHCLFFYQLQLLYFQIILGKQKKISPPSL